MRVAGKGNSSVSVVQALWVSDIRMEESRDVDHPREEMRELLSNLIAINVVVREVLHVVNPGSINDCSQCQ